MSERLQRYQALLRARAAVPVVSLLPAPAAVRGLHEQDVDLDYVNAPRFGEQFELHALPAAAASVDALLADLSAQLDGQRWTSTVDGLRRSVLQTIGGQFGVGKLVSAFDQTGGRVDTIHNVRAGVYSSVDEAQRYAERGTYDSGAYHRDPDYIAANRQMAASLKDGTLTDAYTGESFAPSDRHDRQRKPHLDHVVAGRKVHDDPGRVLAELGGANLAATRENLKPTAASINCALGDRSATLNLQRLAATRTVRAERIAALQGAATPLNDRQRKQLTKLQALSQVDAARVKDAEAQAQVSIDGQLNRAYYGGGKFARSAAAASVTEGASMGMQQALGVVLVEFFAALFDEIGGLYRHGMQEQRYIEEAAVRLRRISARIAGKWETVLTAFKEGFITGLLSSLVTTVVNAFLTTGKRAVRLIREGGLSLLQAVRLLVFRPEGMSGADAMHAASKLMTGALVVAGGIMLEEVVGKYLIVLGPLAAGATAIVVGSLTAIVAALAAYLIDRLDLFGAEQQVRERRIDSMIDARIAAFERCLDEWPAKAT